MEEWQDTDREERRTFVEVPSDSDSDAWGPWRRRRRVELQHVPVDMRPKAGRAPVAAPRPVEEEDTEPPAGRTAGHYAYGATAWLVVLSMALVWELVAAPWGTLGDCGAGLRSWLVESPETATPAVGDATEGPIWSDLGPGGAQQPAR